MSQCSSGRNKNPPALAVGSVKKYSKDDGKMDVFIRSNENMSHMDRMAAEVMKCIGKIPMEIEEGGEVNMCKAIDDMMEKREQKGKLEGKQEILMELLKDKDTIEWVYTCDLGKDVGDNYQAKGKK